MAVRAVFFDIDGTLRSFRTRQIPPEAAEAVRRLRARGIRTFIATGRMPRQVAVVGDLNFDGYVTYNGAGCFDGAWQPVEERPLPADDLRRLADYLREHALTVTLMYRDRLTTNREDAAVNALMRECGVEPPVVCDPAEALREPVYQASIYAGPEQVREMMQEVFVSCVSSRWHPLFADVNVRGATKQAGMDCLLAHYGIALADTMAFGDGGNDIPMLRHAAVGVAMGNASDEVKAAADYVTRSVDDDGIGYALRRFGVG